MTGVTAGCHARERAQIAEVPGYEGYPMWQAPNQISGGGLAPREAGFEQPRSYVEVDSIDEVVATATEA